MSKKDNHKSSIVIFGDLFSFPEGNAATNRVYTYAKGFIENGVAVHVISFLDPFTSIGTGHCEGITYYYSGGEKPRSRYRIARGFQKIGKYLRVYRQFKKINREEKIIAINSWTNLFSVHLFAWIISKRCSTKLVLEISEHPMRYYQGSSFRKLRGRIKFYFESRLCSGIFCISRYLVDYYKSKGVRSQKLFLVPSTVDPGRFTNAGIRPIQEPYIGYFGSLSFKRDNVDCLINAFAEFHKKHSGINLVLGGFCVPEERTKIIELIAELGIAQEVKLLEYLSREEVIRYQLNAEALVMVRSNDLAAEASYPSKLTEFLATGKPVVSVNLGEISDFLTDGLNAYLVEPGNASALAEKLSYLFYHFEQATNVGKRGRELTMGVFNYNYQSKRMLAFIHSLYQPAKMRAVETKEDNAAQLRVGTLEND